MAKPKRLTLQAMAKLDKKFDERKKVYLLGEFEEYVDVHFRKTKINALLVNYFEILNDLKQRNDITSETILNSVSLINALIIKYFSSVVLPDIKNVEQLLVVSNSLVNLGVMDEIFGNNGFPKDQIEFVSQEINKNARLIVSQLGDAAIASALNEPGDAEDATV